MSKATVKRERLRSILSGDKAISVASVFDPVSARMASDIGFDLAIVGGSVASQVTLAAPDIGLLTLTELAGLTQRISMHSAVSLIVDGDGGYGNSSNVMRTVEELEYAGAAMVTIEDTELPSAYGQQGHSLISIEEASDKIKSALWARSDNRLAIFARTMGNQPLPELLARVQAFTKAGADGICLFNCESKAALLACAEHTPLPIFLINYARPQWMTAALLLENRVKALFEGHKTYKAAMAAAHRSLAQCFEGEVNSNALFEATPQDFLNDYALPTQQG